VKLVAQDFSSHAPERISSYLGLRLGILRVLVVDDAHRQSPSARPREPAVVPVRVLRNSRQSRERLFLTAWHDPRHKGEWRLFRNADLSSH